VLHLPYGQGDENPSQNASQAASRESITAGETPPPVGGAVRTTPYAIANDMPQSTTNK